MRRFDSLLVAGRRAPAAALFAAALAAASACGNGAVGVDACRKVESARCRQAPACGIVIDPPHHVSGTDVDACIRYYDVACEHGLSVGDPGGSAVDACVAAIETGDCSLVRAPVSGACSWLGPQIAIAASSSSSSDAAAPDSGDAAAE